MKLEDFFIELEKYMNIPVSYDHFKDTPTIPFIAYIDTGKNTFVADGRIYTKSRNIRIELYTAKKDFNLEDKLESFLEDKFGVWEDDETIYIKEEDLFMHSYYVQI